MSPTVNGGMGEGDRVPGGGGLGMLEVCREAGGLALLKLEKCLRTLHAAQPAQLERCRGSHRNSPRLPGMSRRGAFPIPFPGRVASRASWPTCLDWALSLGLLMELSAPWQVSKL